jgi:hypothetical protein
MKRIIFKTKHPKASQILRDGLSHLFNYLESELTTKGEMRDCNLITGCLGREILGAADRESVPLEEIWSAMRESALLDEYLRVYQFRLSRETSFLMAVARYLKEQNDSVGWQMIIETIGSERRWNQLAAGISKDRLRRNIQWLADWIEADIAYAAFVGKRTNRKIFSGNLIRNVAALVMTWLRTGTMSERSQRNRWLKEMYELGSVHKQDFIDRSKEVTDGLRSADKLPAYPTSPLEEWLFRIWPLVIHYEWTKPEIVACVPEQWDREDQFKNYPDYFLRCRGLRIGGDGGRPIARPNPPRKELAVSWMRKSQ